MTAFSITDLYDFLSSKFDKETARNFATFIEVKIQDELDNKTQIFATKEDISKIISRVEQVESRLELKISETKNDTIKWMVALWLALGLIIIGLYLK